jgi:tetratricopeptide (TPR) repeat protein
MELSEQVKVAYEAVKRGESPYAREILEEVLTSNPSDESAWFVYAYATNDRAEAMECLGKVLELNPSNERARRDLDRLQYPQTKNPRQQAGMLSASASPRMQASARLPAPPQKPASKGSSTVLLLGAGGAVFLLAACGILFLLVRNLF